MPILPPGKTKKRKANDDGYILLEGIAAILIMVILTSALALGIRIVARGTTKQNERVQQHLIKGNSLAESWYLPIITETQNDL